MNHERNHFRYLEICGTAGEGRDVSRVCRSAGGSTEGFAFRSDGCSTGHKGRFSQNGEHAAKRNPATGLRNSAGQVDGRPVAGTLHWYPGLAGEAGLYPHTIKELKGSGVRSNSNLTRAESKGPGLN